jgi:hypothetical protein
MHKATIAENCRQGLPHVLVLAHRVLPEDLRESRNPARCTS